METKGVLKTCIVAFLVVFPWMVAISGILPRLKVSSNHRYLIQVLPEERRKFLFSNLGYCLGVVSQVYNHKATGTCQA